MKSRSSATKNFEALYRGLCRWSPLKSDVMNASLIISRLSVCTLKASSLSHPIKPESRRFSTKATTVVSYLFSLLLRNKPSKPSTRASRQSGKEETAAGTRWVGFTEVLQNRRARRGIRQNPDCSLAALWKRTFHQTSSWNLSKCFQVICVQNENKKSCCSAWAVWKGRYDKHREFLHRCFVTVKEQ